MEFKPIPSTASETNERGVALAEQGNYPGAVLAFTQALEMHPDFQQARWNRGSAYFELRDIQTGASDYLATIVATGRELQTNVANRRVSQRAGNFKAMTVGANRAMDLMNEVNLSLVTLGKRLLRAGKTEVGTKCIRAAYPIGRTTQLLMILAGGMVGTLMGGLWLFLLYKFVPQVPTGAVLANLILGFFSGCVGAMHLFHMSAVNKTFSVRGNPLLGAVETEGPISGWKHGFLTSSPCWQTGILVGIAVFLFTRRTLPSAAALACGAAPLVVGFHGCIFALRTVFLLVPQRRELTRELEDIRRTLNKPAV